MSYLETRYNSTYRPDPAFYRFKARRLMNFVRLFYNRPVKSFLDLGSGCGDLAEGMHTEFGLGVAGIERDAAMARCAQDKKIGEFFLGDLLELRAEWKGRFDMVNSFEVFEHLTREEHPRALELYRLYGAKDALGAIMVPNAANPFLGGWLSWSDYTHRSCFTPESLSQMLRENGVEAAKIFPWYSAGSPALLSMRTLAGRLSTGVFKFMASAFTTIPGSGDQFVSDALPLSSHLIALFRIPQ